MKIRKLTSGLLVSLLLTATSAIADSKYPATDFQPKVVYQDTDYKQTKSASSSSSKAEMSRADSNYPAANFQPEVVYQDKNYKHSKDKASSYSSPKSAPSSSNSSGSSSNDGTEAESGDSSFSLVLGLAVLAVAGYVFYSKTNKKAKPARRKGAPTVVSSNQGSVSGVAKYLESKDGPKPSGVAKYLEAKEGDAISGVAKYVAKQKITEKIASVTGVEKYLKERS